MPPDHDQLVALLFRIMFIARTGSGELRLHDIREAVATGMRTHDSNRVGLRVWAACERIASLIDNRGLDTPYIYKKIEQACEAAVPRPRLDKVSQKTWEEQLAGRTRLLELQNGEIEL